MSDTRKSPSGKNGNRKKSDKGETKAKRERPRTLLRYCHPALWGFDRKKP